MRKTKKIYDVYLAGAMHFRPVGEVLAERARAKLFCNLYGLSYYDPSSDEGLDKLDWAAIVDGKPSMETMEHYISKDESALDQCRTILVLTGDKSSSGTAWECARAYYELNIPIILVAPKMYRGELRNFTSIKAYYIDKTQEGAIAQIRHTLNWIKRR